MEYIMNLIYNRRLKGVQLHLEFNLFFRKKLNCLTNQLSFFQMSLCSLCYGFLMAKGPLTK